ncbi:hypothetical protein KC352_g39407, partial [Hortaea werneckii]
NGAPPFPPPQGIDLAALLSGGQLPPPPNGAQPNFANGMPPLPPGFAPPPGFPMPGNMPGLPGSTPTPSNGANGGGGNIRKRAPLPSQQESLAEEMRHGRYKKAR